MFGTSTEEQALNDVLASIILLKANTSTIFLHED